jgi:hypothetical protein
MPTQVIDVNRQRPFDTLITVSMGDDLNLRFPVTDENDNPISSPAPTDALLEIRDKPAPGEAFLSKTLRASVAFVGMTVAMPNIDVAVNVTASPVTWQDQAVGQRYWLKIWVVINGRRRTISEFEILVTS